MSDRNTFQGIAIKFHYVRRPNDKYSITVTKILFHFVENVVYQNTFSWDEF